MALTQRKTIVTGSLQNAGKADQRPERELNSLCPRKTMSWALGQICLEQIEYETVCALNGTLLSFGEAAEKEQRWEKEIGRSVDARQSEGQVESS